MPGQCSAMKYTPGQSKRQEITAIHLYLITCARVLLRYRTGHTDCIYMPTHRLINTHEDLQKELAHKVMGIYVSVDLGSLMVLFSIRV